MIPLTDGTVITGEAVYCDAGRHIGMYRLDISASIYLTPEQLAAAADNGIVLAIQAAVNENP